jgi:hypothetical protein
VFNGMNAALLQMASLNFEPLHFRPHNAGDWSGHVPFAYDLVAALRPKTIVELGVQYGESYFAFCQAVAECGVACRAFAVDTWRGDPHTGAYSEAVYREVLALNQQHYAGFSTLLRTTFDEAVGSFLDGSVDVLHIDGLHTYEAVSHDFETWFPKVSPGGIILMHDTQIRRNDFGVWRLWDELRTRYRSFEFRHSCGLGVIEKPGDTGVRSDFTSLLFQDEEQAETLRRFYLICGERLEYKDRIERRQRSGEWELLVKLFWRGPGEEFSEARSIHARGECTARPGGIRLELPRDTAIEELRVDVLESPAFMRIHAFRLVSPNDELVWFLPAEDIQNNLTSTTLQLTPGDNGSTFAAVLVGEPPVLLLNIPQVELCRLAGGGSLQIEISGLGAGEYAAGLNSIMQQSVQVPEVALAEGQRLIGEREREIRRYDKALGEAQAIVKQGNSEIQRYDKALGEAQAIVDQRNSEIRVYDKALAEAQAIVEQRNSEIRSYDRALAETQATVEQRNSEIRRYDEALVKAQRLVSEGELEIGRNNEALAEAQALVVQRTGEIDQAREALTDAARVLREQRERLDSLREEIRRLEDERRALTLRLAAIEQSLGWRILKRLRPDRATTSSRGM